MNRLTKGMIKEDKQRYNVFDIYIGCIARRRVDANGNISIAQIIDSKLRIFKHTALDCFVDLEYNNYYPLMSFGERPYSDDYYIPERLLHKNTEEFQQLLEEKGIDLNAKLTIKEIRELVDIQQQKNEKIF